jgi:hypothetical protein
LVLSHNFVRKKRKKEQEQEQEQEVALITHETSSPSPSKLAHQQPPWELHFKSFFLVGVQLGM